MNQVRGMVFSLRRSILMGALVLALVVPLTPASADAVPPDLVSVRDSFGVQSAVGNVTQEVPDLVQIHAAEQLGEAVMELPRPDPPRLDGWAGPKRGQLELVWERAQPASGLPAGTIQIQGGVAPVRNYTLYVSGDPAQGFEPLVTLSAQESGFVHEGLQDGRTLHYQVAAANEFGEGPPSKTVSLTTWSPPGRVVFLWAQQDSRDGDVRLSWLPPVRDGGLNLTQYTVYASPGREGPFTEVATVDSGSLSFTDRELASDEVRYYRVAATNGLGEGEASRSVRAVGLAAKDLAKVPGDRVPDPGCALGECDDKGEGPGGPDDTGPDAPGSGGVRGTTTDSSAVAPGPGDVVDPVVATGVAVGALTIVFPLVQLYRRIAARSALEHTRRRAVYEQILERPGATTADLARTLHLHYSTVRHHLDLLRVVEEVEARRIHGRMRWFPNHRTYGVVAKAAAAALAVESQKKIIQTLLDDPGICAGEIARRLLLAPPTVSHHLKRLSTLGLVERHREAQWVRYRLAPEVPKALQALKNPA